MTRSLMACITHTYITQYLSRKLRDVRKLNFAASGSVFGGMRVEVGAFLCYTVVNEKVMQFFH
jgi:F0F1-type ATP synthase delta subunit